MTALTYIACCMGLSFIVGLGMGIHMGHVTAWEAAERRMHHIVLDYAEQVRQLRLRERALVARSMASGLAAKENVRPNGR